MTLETTTITGRPNASLPLTGDELVIMDQGSTTPKAKASDVAKTLPDATPTTPGKMSAADKTRLDQLGADDSPTFAGLTLSGLAANRLLFTGSGGVFTGLTLGSGLSIVDGALVATASGGAVTLSMPTGFSVSGSGSSSLGVTFAAGYALPTTAKQGEWDTAYSERLRWDGGATGLDAATARTSLGLGTAATTDASAYATAAQGAKADTAVQPAALAIKADLVDGLVPSAQLPGFVDDVLEFASVAGFPVTGETGKLYVSLATNRVYRWSGSIYVEITPSPGSTDAVPEGSVNLYFTNGRGEASAASWWAASTAKTKLDGIATGAEVNVPTNLSYDAATRVLASSTGDDATLPVVSTGAAGLQPATGFGTIVYAAQVTLDLAVLAGQANKITLTGSLELAATNLALGRSTGLLLDPGASQRTITFPVDWKPVGAKPASIPANKLARLSLECWGTSASDVVFGIAIQP